jgi:hypothetical protein
MMNSTCNLKNAATGTKQIVPALEELNAKLMSSTSEGKGEVSSSLCAGNENYLSATWIIDSGATNPPPI